MDFLKSFGIQVDIQLRKNWGFPLGCVCVGLARHAKILGKHLEEPVDSPLGVMLSIVA